MKIESPSGRTPSRLAIAASLAVVVVVWSVNFIAAKIGLQYLPAPAMAAFRVVLAGAVMVPTYFLASRLPAFAEATALRRQGFSGRDLWVFLYLGFFAVAVNQTCFTIGLEFTSVSHASVIVGLGPIYILVLAVLFRMEHANGHKVIGMVIALAGIAVLASENGLSLHSPSLAGDAITMTGSIGLAIYAVLGKRVATQYDSLTMTAFSHFAGAILLLPLAVFEAGNLLRSPNWPIPWQGWAAVLYMAVFSSALAYVFYFWLLRYLEASQLGAFTYLLPVFATILGILWLGEKGSWRQVTGGLLALGGVYWIESGRAVAAKKNSVL